MDLNDFYSADTKLWKAILGEKMHYHYAVYSKVNDPFDQAIINLFPFIQNKSKVLDCGCGWGGPGRLIQKKLDCEVTGITISKSQYEYIQDFKVLYEDLETFAPDKKYDVAIFIESYTHLQESSSMLKRFYNNVDSILIKDFVAPYEEEIPKWKMRIRTKSLFIQELKNAGYQIKEYYEIENFFQPAIDFWMENLMRLKPIYITGHIKELFDLCSWYKYEEDKTPGLKQCVIYATK
jgi:cyclopropane fatty-acyl-phospholipid synthase-like methyltransferase